MFIDFKIKGWERINILDDIQDEVRKACEEGKVTSSNSLFELFSGREDNLDGVHMVSEANEQMEVIENDEAATIELLKENGVTLWNNKMFTKGSRYLYRDIKTFADNGYDIYSNGLPVIGESLLTLKRHGVDITLSFILVRTACGDPNLWAYECIFAGPKS